jgi:hypothetical protein
MLKEQSFVWVGRERSKNSRLHPLPLQILYAAKGFLPINVRAFIGLLAPRLKRVLAGSNRLLSKSDMYALA